MTAPADTQTAEQTARPARGHQPWVFATRTVTLDAWGIQRQRIRYRTGYGMDRLSRRKAKV